MLILLLFPIIYNITRSWGYEDELVWAAAWLYKATEDSAYLDKAEQYYNDFNLAYQDWFFSWDNKKIGVHTLMAELTGDQIYKDSVQGFCDYAVSGQSRSPGGMLFYDGWGSLRYASNVAFICLKVNKYKKVRHCYIKVLKYTRNNF